MSSGSTLAPRAPLVIYGNGAMAATYASYLQSSYEVVAYTVEDSCCHSNTFCNLPLVAFEALADHYPPQQHRLIVAVGYREMNDLRANISQRAWAMGFQPAQFIAPDLWLHTGVSIGQNSVVFDHCSIHCNSRVGDNTFIASGVHIGHDCNIGDNVWINSGVAIAGGVTVGDNCFFGVNASVAHGVVLAPGTFVGANTLVTRNTQANQVVVSEPGTVFELDSRTYLLLLEGRRC
ncbi:DapH/DapD/GlmU-related protein [Halioxenophilus sp. WMMB6]|uniref:DapH/DapD/GlmU-related protein n=1 Tax=Halioxenophilus sp. WMMB6 TaxID=3073815 RepID=UPI00295EF339|nr:DapH/DapD/GlmU-related protein [Halioxenophilus sp. WMMB6]